MEALIWQRDSIDGVDHGASCAAFASLTLELGAQVVGHQSWVTGGSSYPWPLHEWADVRVDANPASVGITSIVQDAQAHHRWHPLGDGYQPQPGDWVLFNGHVEVVRSTPAGSWTRSAAIPCRISPSTPTSTPLRSAPRAWSDSSTTAASRALRSTASEQRRAGAGGQRSRRR